MNNSYHSFLDVRPETLPAELVLALGAYIYVKLVMGDILLHTI
jgi:hypothetical protein